MLSETRSALSDQTGLDLWPENALLLSETSDSPVRWQQKLLLSDKMAASLPSILASGSPAVLDPHPHAANALPMAGEMAVLAERYAGVLYDLAAEGGNLDAVTADMRGLRQIWGECPEWRAVATDPRLMPGEAIAATAAITKASALNTLTGNFIGVVAHNRRLAHLPCIIHFFLRIVAARRGEVNADIRTTQPLSAAQRDALAASLGSIAGGKINLTVIEDASILGGLTVKIGSSLIDASVKTKLDLLERTLIAGAAA